MLDKSDRSSTVYVKKYSTELEVKFCEKLQRNLDRIIIGKTTIV